MFKLNGINLHMGPDKAYLAATSHSYPDTSTLQLFSYVYNVCVCVFINFDDHYF